MKKKQIIFTIVFIALFTLALGLATLISLFILDILNGPFILLIINIILLTGVVIARVVLYKHKIYFRIIPWGVYMVAFFVLSLFAEPIIATRSIAYFKNPEKTEVLSLEVGDIVGLYNKDKTVEMYGGIPYAKAPVGELRFKSPVEPDKWEGVRDCTHFPNRAMQVDDPEIQQSLVDIYAEQGWHPNFETKCQDPMSEDCLYLNVWKPHTEESNLPVFVYIHGGALVHGKSSYEDYNGETFAKNGVIMITIQYRLGVFGYLAHPDLAAESEFNVTGNYGLQDQIQALRWINEHIDEFGGDPNNITIAGESAGSSSVSALCISQPAKGLFKRAIGESSSIVQDYPPHTFWSMEEAVKTTKESMKELGCETIDDLRRLDAVRLLSVTNNFPNLVRDGYFISDTMLPKDIYAQGLNNEEALLNGYNVKEADGFYIPRYLFSPTNIYNIKERIHEEFPNDEIAERIYNAMKSEIEKDAFSAMNEIMAVKWFIQPHHYWSNYALTSPNMNSVYRYQFTKENGHYGTNHSGELIYAYGNLNLSLQPYAYNSSDYYLSDIMVKYWTNFAKTGNPNAEGLPEWKEYNPNDSKPIMELGSNINMFEDKYLELYKIMDDYYQSLN